ncbi:MAG: hypothetical protein IPF55_08335 [Rhodoferax sp.]|nr:hypothetical protein [Rhodoferax sp.]
MLRIYSAQLNGTQPDGSTSHRLTCWRYVLVVVNDVNPTAQDAPKPARRDMSDLAGRPQWRGNAVAVQRAQRDST